MIQNFRHKGLQRYFERGDSSKLNQNHVPRIRRILTAINAADRIEQVDLPGFGLHSLKGNLKGFYAVKVSGNWRVIFRFEDGSAFEVDYLDYH